MVQNSTFKSSGFEISSKILHNIGEEPAMLNNDTSNYDIRNDTFGLICRKLEKKDFNNVLKLMNEIQPVIVGGLRCPSLYRAFCYDALIDKRVLFIVAEEKTDIVGFRIVVIDMKNWRLTFCKRHPVLTLRILTQKICNNIRIKITTKKNLNIYASQYAVVAGFVNQTPCNKSWNDSSPQIAKALYVAVKESHRGKNIAAKLIEYGNQILVNHGQKRIDDRILFNNIASIRLHHRLGFNIYKSGHALFVTKELPIIIAIMKYMDSYG